VFSFVDVSGKHSGSSISILMSGEKLEAVADVLVGFRSFIRRGRVLHYVA